MGSGDGAEKRDVYPVDKVKILHLVSSLRLKLYDHLGTRRLGNVNGYS